MTRPALHIDVRPNGVAVITYDVEGEAVNTLKPSFADEFERVFGEIARNASIKAAVLISGKRDAFIAGADITMLKSVETSGQAEAMCRAGHAAMKRLVDCPKPVVAAIHGAALGGGLEVALACDARVLSDDKKTVLGLPEVKLGLLPGLNGLQRLAAIVGLEVALDYGLTGKTMGAQKAKTLGVADDVVSESILCDVAADLALTLAKKGFPFRPLASKKKTSLRLLVLEKNPLGRALLFKRARKEVLKKTGGHYPAPERIIDVLNGYARHGFDASIAIEAKSIGELVVGDVARRLIEVFFATTASKKDTGVDDPSIRPRNVEQVGVYTSRILRPYMDEANTMLAEGASMDQIDDALIGWGWEVGPFTRLRDRVVRARSKAKRGPIPREEIQMRCSLLLVNEALRCLGEGILRSPRDGDLGAIFGLGFPAFRGGPLRYVDVLGAREVCRRLEGYEKRFGVRFAPAPALVDLAKSGKKLYS